MADMAASKDIPLILASASPRRKEILEAHGYAPIVIPAGVDESLPENSRFTPEETTMYLAGLKAASVLGALAPEDWPLGCAILGVDTIVYRGRIIGKPVDEADALGILRSLRNGPHEVISGVCIIRAVPQPSPGQPPSQPAPAASHRPAPAQQASATPAPTQQAAIPNPGQPPGRPHLAVAEKTLFSDTTTVCFGDYSDEEILAYIRANPPYDKSGSYAIQSDWGRHVLWVEGDIENVIGLPIKKISPYLAGFLC